MRKLLFLDVDGVLNIMSSSYYTNSYENLGNDSIEPHLMARLEFILDRVKDLDIVLSSSWDIKKFTKVLKQNRFKYLHRLIGKTCNNKEHRGNQILDWIEKDPVKHYVVLEDEVDDVCGDKCNSIPKDKVIEVDMNQGLSHSNAVDAVIKLNSLSEFDGSSSDFNAVSYYNLTQVLGYRLNVAIPKKNGALDMKKFYEMWDTYTVDNKNLAIYLSKKN